MERLDTLINIPYPKGFFKDGRESNWYIDMFTLDVYKKVKFNDKVKYLEQIDNIPSFVFGSLKPEHQKYLRNRLGGES